METSAVRRFAVRIPALALLCLWSCAPRHAEQVIGDITSVHDEFRRTDSLVLTYWIRYDSRIVLRSNTSSPGTLALAFHSHTERWRYLQCREVDALVDGEPVPLPAFEHTGVVVSAREVAEALVTVVPIETIERMAHAATVRFRVCGDESALTPVQIESLRTYLRRLHGSPGTVATAGGGGT